MEMNMSRRSFVAGSAAAASMMACGSLAMAQEVSSAPSESWMDEAPQISDADCVEILECDVLVVGCGAAGLPAAATAAEEGLKVIAVDRMEQGYGIRSSALAAIDSSLQQEVGVQINKEDILNDIAHYANGMCDMRLWKLWADESGEAISWYIDHCNKSGGAYVENEYNVTQGTRYPTWPTGHATIGSAMPWAGEAVMLEYFIGLIESHEGCEHRGYTKLESLILDDGAVIGAYLSTGEEFDSFIRVNAAKGVVIATGGYILNAQMMGALQPTVVAGLAAISTSGQSYGEGIQACMRVGAKLEDVHSTMVFDRGFCGYDQEIGHPYSEDGQARLVGVVPIVGGPALQSQPFLKVNQYGERFCNESSPYDYVFHAANKFPNKAWYPIWDANYLEDVERFHTIGCSTQLLREGGDHLMGKEPESVVEYVEQKVAAGDVIKADTIEELAEGLGLPADALRATVERYNELCDAQYDSDFGKEAFRLSKVAEPPFYGQKLGGAALCTLDGIEVTPELEALDAEGKVIPGLYVIGNDAGNHYHMTYPNFSAGLNAGRCVTEGRHVARALAAR